MRAAQHSTAQNEGGTAQHSLCDQFLRTFPCLAKLSAKQCSTG
jgi:hypothetical protein